jgi:hypothetical protein
MDAERRTEIERMRLKPFKGHMKTRKQRTKKQREIVYIPNNLLVCTRKPRMLITGKTVNNKRPVIPALDATIVPRDRVQKMPAIAEMTEKWLLEFNTSELVYTSQFQTTLHNNQGITRSMHLPFDQ